MKPVTLTTDIHGEDKFRCHQSKDEALDSAALQFRFYENLFTERGELGHAYAAGFHAKMCEYWRKQ